MRKLGWATTGLVFWAAPLLGGTADRPYTLLCAALCALCVLFLALIGHRHGLARPRLSWFHAFFALAIVATLLQALPLPPALRALLAPGSDAELRQIVGLSEPDAAHRWFPLSLDPGETLHEATRLAGYLCLLLALSTIVQGGRARRTLLAQIHGAAALVAGLGFLCGLGLAALPSPIGVPGQGATRALFPAALLNSNHMAALMGLGGLLLLDAAQALRREATDPATKLRVYGLYALFALCDVVLVGTLSRAGITVWLGAQALWLPLQLRRRGRLPRIVGLLGALPIGLLALISQWQAAWTALQLRFAATTVPGLTAPGSKVHAWIEAWPLLRGHLPFGIGRGAFENAFQHVQGLAGKLRFVYLENEWLQTIVDWGVPVALALFGLLFLALRDALARTAELENLDERDTSRVALIGLLALGLHNLFDFNLEVGGVAFAAVGLCAVCQKPLRTLSRGPAAALGIVTLIGIAVVALRHPSPDEDGAKLRELCARADVNSQALVTAARAAALRHPFDAYLPALAAARLLADPQQTSEAVGWVNRALLANPREISARHSAARLLLANGHREQALLLLHDAISDADGEPRRQLLRTLRAASRDLDEVLTTLPDAAARDEFLDILGASSPVDWPLLRGLTMRMLAQNEAKTSAASWLGRAALALKDGDAAATAMRALLADSAGQAGLLFADLGELLIDGNRAAEAEDLLNAGLSRGERPEIFVALAHARERQGAIEAARRLLNFALERSSDVALTARIHELFADLETRAGNASQAALHRGEAARLRAP